ncbi:MAG TPA: DUF3853 family protein [Flavobacterium lutivivi]|nr:DUF3853 family protein [Flavobacterium lutivivi]
MTLINDSTPLSFLTVGDFLKLMNAGKKSEPVYIPDTSKRLVYGLRGIRTLFNVSHATAYRYKETIIKDAVSQQGRKIVVDVDKALELFNAKNGGHN